MTREEAIDIFEHNWTKLVNPDYTEGELNKAIGMAIKALKQEPCVDATNGQVLLQMFPPSVYFGDDEKHIVLLTKDCELTCYNNEWWNAPYKAESEVRNEQK